MFKLVCQNIKKKDVFILLAGVFSIVGSIWLELSVPSFMSKITNILIDTTTFVGSKKVEAIIEQGLLMLICALGSAIVASVATFSISYFGCGIAKTIRSQMFTKVQNFSPNDFAKFSIPSLITRSTNDISQVQNFVSRGLQMFVRAPIMAVWAVCIILNKSWQWTVATAVGVVGLLSMLMFVMLFAMPKFKIVQKQTDRLNQCTRENLTGVRVVRAFNAENFEEKKFEKVNKDVSRTNLFIDKVMSMIGPVMSLIMNCLTLAVYIIGAVLINRAIGLDRATLFSDMIVFSSYAMQIIMSFMMISIIFVMLPRASVSATRINEVLTTKPSIKDGNLDPETLKEKGTIEFKNVSFRYPGAEEYMIKDLSFKLQKGETLAFIGPTGSGKSTIVSLIMRFYDVTSGEILIDGINIKKYKLKDLYNRIGYVPQKAYLFSETVAENINFGECNYCRNESDIYEALKIAEANSFVSDMENGIHSEIAQSGQNISGGQKQRLSIARAVSRRPEILILDDCFSALDFKTDKMVRANIKNWSEGITTIMVAQRIGTIQEANQIIVLDRGVMVGSGNHIELLENCDLYREIYESQIQKEVSDGCDE